MNFKRAVLVLSFLILNACSTVTINPGESLKLSTQPTYQETKNFFLWGLVGEHRIDVSLICQDQNVAQMQSQSTFVNGLLGGLTLGIYSPHSVKVWCN